MSESPRDKKKRDASVTAKTTASSHSHGNRRGGDGNISPRNSVRFDDESEEDWLGGGEGNGRRGVVRSLDAFDTMDPLAGTLLASQVSAHPLLPHISNVLYDDILFIV